MAKARLLREIQSDAIKMRDDLWKLVDEAFRRGCDYQAEQEPQFAPPIVRDEYRDAWQRIEPADDYRADVFRITVSSRCDLDGVYESETMTITERQMKHILAYLSEQNREDRP